MADSVVKLKLSVWRDYIPSKALVLHRGVDAPRHLPSSDSALQQEIYCWHTREDPFAGISDDEIRAKLRSLLLDAFDPSLPPSERRFSSLRPFLEEASRAVNDQKSEWAISQDPPADDEEWPYRLNPLLALKLHLDWLTGCFLEQPGISVSVR